MISNILALMGGFMVGYFLTSFIKENFSKKSYYYYKGKPYIKIGEGKMKVVPDKWTNCVIYKSVHTEEYYVRYKWQFDRHFKTSKQFSEPEEGEQSK